MQAQNGLSEAISSGDGFAIIKSGLEYYSMLEDRADLGPVGHDAERGLLSDSNEALLDSITSAIGLGRALDAGDGWGIAGESVNLLRDIDNYLTESGSVYSSIISDKGSALLGVGASGIGLAQAIEAGNDWGIAQSSVSLIEEIDNYFTPISENGKTAASALDETFGTEVGTAGTALSGAGSALGLAMNISQIDDVFESGDIGAMTYAAASTFNNAINTYNAAASLMGASNACISTIPGLAYVGAVIQLLQGDVVGAAISAATAALMMCGPYGWIAAAVLQIGSMLFGDDDPPEASASFTLDADGGVAMEIHGDSAMRGTAEAYGQPMVTLMENYQENGGRLLIDGSLPTLRVVQGESSAIEYRSDTGGRTSVVVDDPSQAIKEMSAALYARDRGERLDSAIEVARDVHGDLDLGKVDTIMAGHGFVKNGMTYTYGETGSRTAASWGSGVMHGGGNVGPEGRVFTAKAEDFSSLPLRPEQLPRQQLGDIIRNVSLNTLFTGAGSELLAVALGFSGGLLNLAVSAQAGQNVAESNNDYVKPLGGAERDNYLLHRAEVAQLEKAVEEESPQVSIPEITDPVAMQHFLAQHWSDLLRTTRAWPDVSADGVYHYRDTIGYDSLLSDGNRAPWWEQRQTENFYRQLVQQGVIESEFLTDVAVSTSGHLVAPEDVERYLSTDVVLSLPPPGVEQGAVFAMAEDSILRFLPAQLAENSLSSEYGNMAESYTFVSFGEVSNGRVWLETNGDLRFAPTPGFVGTGSFVYTVKTPSGELVERLATVLVHNVNDQPLLADDTFSLPEGEMFYLDRLSANDRDPEGDTLLLDHFRGVEHGEVALVNGRLAFVPEEGYHGDIEFSYWIRDHAASYPVMAWATLTYTDINKGPVPGDDRFIVIEDTPLSHQRRQDPG